MELMEFESVVKKILAGKKVTSLDKKLDKWLENNPAFLTEVNCNHILHIVINENKYLHKKPVPKNYLNLRDNYLSILRNCL